MKKDQVIRAWKIIDEVDLKVYSLLKTIDMVDDVQIQAITEAGIEIRTEYTHCGSCGMDYDYHTLTWEQLWMTPEQYKADFKAKQAELKAKREADEAKAKAEKEAADKLAKEEADRKKYEELKAKYEPK